MIAAAIGAGVGVEAGVGVGQSQHQPVGFVTVPFSSNGHEIDLWSWAGQRLRVIHVQPQVIGDPLLSPDGTQILMPALGAGSDVLDLSGHVVAEVSGGNAVWADDGTHVCSLRLEPGEASVFVKDQLLVVNPGHPARVAAVVPGVGPHMFTTIASCDVTNQVATLLVNVLGTDEPPLYVNLRNGSQRSASWQGELFAQSGNGRYGARQEAGSWVIVDVSSGQVVGRVASQVTALSWLGDLAVEDLEQTQQVAVVDWRTGKTLWATRPSRPSGYAGAITRPGTDDLALTVLPRVTDPGGRQLNLWLIAPGQAPKLLDANVRT